MAEKATIEAAAEKRVPSTVSIHQHPLHPILVVFPLGLLITALGADALYWWTRDAFFARGAWWLIGGGLAGGVVSAVVGFVDFITIRYSREQISSWSHMVAGISVLSLATANLLLRWPDPEGAVLPWGLLLSVDTFIMLIVTGWLGGNLTFRHLIGSYLEEEEKHALAEIKAASPSRETQSP